MPRFFLNTRRRAEYIPDLEGDEVGDRAAAVRLALDTLSEMRRLPHVYGDDLDWNLREFVITDEAGTVVAIVPFDRPPEKAG